MNRVIYSQENNPYYNIALEKDLLKTADNEMLLFIWQNNKTVVLGRNQNPYSECDLEYAKAQSIKIARRFSGGGAVFHDLGNVNFTFITKENNANLEKQLSVILESVKALGINAAFSGRNDLLVDGKKFSGQAYYTEDENYLHHGTIMLDVNLEMVSKVLTPSLNKLKSKGISSIKSRVINLCDINNNITTNMLINKLVDKFIKIYGSIDKPKYMNMKNYLPDQMRKLEKANWIFGESPQFETCIEKTNSLGTITINLSIKNGFVQVAKVYSDYLEKFSFEKEEKLLIGMKFDKQEILNIF